MRPLFVSHGIRCVTNRGRCPSALGKKGVLMKGRWIRPAIILGLLLLAAAFRWQTEATRSGGLTKWERDLWTGRLWEKTYSTSGVGQRVADPQGWIGPSYPDWDLAKERQRYTLGWMVLTGGAVLWLLVEVRPRG